MGRAAVRSWRRRDADFPAPAGGMDVHPQFDRAAVVAWLLAHDKIGVPIGMPSASLTVVGPRRGTARFRLDGPHLVLTEDAEGEDVLSGWSTDEDADALAALSLDRAVYACERHRETAEDRWLRGLAPETHPARGRLSWCGTFTDYDDEAGG
ncbi:hypothetical protein ACQKM2_35730 [Streptomyces sp. NPDC004126]|uniref:hypothetical protein n=1 Tax=Streptomyces sp. NPDC004126 TaxID=3390695 RepID=UPI003D06D684